MSAAPAAVGATPGGVPDDQPLPGYTISNPPLAPVTVHGQPSRVLQGVTGHAAYDVEVPPGWNGKLVMWAHGYAGQGKTLTVGPPDYGLRQRFLDQGYAWAASSYYDNGYDVRAGVTGTEGLARYVARHVGRVRQRFIAGVSMGGHIIGRSLEQYPRYYSGALPMCGVLGDDALFDQILDYNVVAQDLSGVRAYPAPADYLTNAVPKIEAALGLTGLTPTGPDTTNARGKQLRAIWVDRTGGPRPGSTASFAVWKDFVFSLAVPSPGTTLAENPGQVATNTRTRYTPNHPVNVNRTVQRVPLANPAARYSQRLSQIPLISGRPDVPVLTLHGIGDGFVPFKMEQIYAKEARRNHQSGLVVQRAIRTAQHCEFSNVEAGDAWDALTHWVSTGRRPAGDNVTSSRVVGRKNFGCRFSDPAAYAAGTGTRRLFPAC
jgi:esterase/lipase superfamily enzyme